MLAERAFAFYCFIRALCYRTYSIESSVSKFNFFSLSCIYFQFFITFAWFNRTFFLSFCAIYTKIVEENSKHPKDIVNFKIKRYNNSCKEQNL